MDVTSVPRPIPLSAVSRGLGLGQAADVWRDGWAQSEGQLHLMPDRWLSDEQISEACSFVGLEEEARRACLSTGRWVRASEETRRLAWHCYTSVFHGDPACRRRVKAWPMLPVELAPEAPLFYALVFLSGMPETRRRHRDLGVPESVSRDTLRDLPVWIAEYRRKHGVWGCDEITWLSRHFAGTLYRLGRLQFEMSHYLLDFHSFRHRVTGRVVTLAGEGMRFRSDGQFDGGHGMFDGRRAWTSRCRASGGYREGFPVADAGHVERRMVRLAEKSWTEVLARDDPVLFVHIPAASSGCGRLTSDACRESFEESLRFFPLYFPGHPFRAFTSISWLLDHQLSDYLPPESNIMRFQARFHLCPFPDADGRQIVDRVFGGPVADWDRSSEDTALKRAVAEHVRKGRRWRMGAGFFLAEELSAGVPI